MTSRDYIAEIGEIRAEHILAAIDAKPLATTAKGQYRREASKALAARVEQVVCLTTK